jgi:hypothetical protein
MTFARRAFVVTALLVTAVGVRPGAALATPALLSVGRPVAASSSIASYPPGRAVDGYASSRWASGAGALQWLRVDLGAVRRITGVKVSWGAAYAVGYRLQVSTDGLGWTPVWTPPRRRTSRCGWCPARRTRR